MDEQATRFTHWQQLARRTARKVNLGWWLACLAPLLVAAGVLAFVAILTLRTQGLEVARLAPWLGLLFPLVLAIAFGQARSRFLTPAQALVRLESHLHLHNALTVAQAGRGPWPALPSPQAHDGWQWRWPRLAAPWLATLACIALALWLPLSQEVSALQPAVQPQSWQQMDDWLKKLEEEKLITPGEKDQQAAKIAALREQPPEKWFSHDSLHASDTLKQQLQHDMAKITQNLKTAERSLNALQNHAEKLSEAGKEQLLKDLDEAIQSLQNSPLELNPDLLKELAQIDPNSLPSLSQPQLDQLREALKQGAGTLDNLNPGFLGDGEGEDDQLAEMLDQPGQGQGQPGDMPGAGGLDRGPGTAPLTLSDEENDFGTDKNEGVTNGDLSRAQLGTMLSLKDGKHEVDKTYNGPTTSGQARSPGEGGEQVWRETLTPEEKAVLKRVFK